jgi:uncharacterized protein with PIN domain
LEDSISDDKDKQITKNVHDIIDKGKKFASRCQECLKNLSEANKPEKVNNNAE